MVLAFQSIMGTHIREGKSGILFDAIDMAIHSQAKVQAFARGSPGNVVASGW